MKKQNNILNVIISDLQLSTQLKVILLILERYNCRAGEVLAAKRSLFIPGRMLILKGSKHSNDVIVRDLNILSLIEQLPLLDQDLLFPSVHYQSLYRHVKKNYSHLFIKYKTKKNYKVTHGFRFLNANLINDPASVKSILNHASQASGTYYNSQLPRTKYLKH